MSEGKPYIVPSNSVFVMGDNSENSYDSRIVGTIEKDKIVGKAFKVYYPLNNERSLE